jgi:hypothetical protein
MDVGRSIDLIIAGHRCVWKRFANNKTTDRVTFITNIQLNQVNQDLPRSMKNRTQPVRKLFWISKFQDAMQRGSHKSSNNASQLYFALEIASKILTLLCQLMLSNQLIEIQCQAPQTNHNRETVVLLAEVRRLKLIPAAPLLWSVSPGMAVVAAATIGGRYPAVGRTANWSGHYQR